MFSNLFYFLRLLFAASPALVIGELAWGVLTVLPGQLVSVLGVKYVIDIVTSGGDLKRLYAVVAGVVALLALCRLASYLYREFFWNVQREKAYYRLNRRLYAKRRSWTWRPMMTRNFTTALFSPLSPPATISKPAGPGAPVLWQLDLVDCHFLCAADH